MKNSVLDTTHPTFVRRLAKAINSECAANGFYSGWGVTPEMGGGQRKFHGHVTVRKGRLLALEVSSRAIVDLTGCDHVNGNGRRTIYASRS
jgi:hypothetical protein